MSLVIALTGTTGVGKTTVADHLVLRHGFQRLRFSDPLKQMMSGLLIRQGCPPDYVKRCIEGDLKTLPVPELAGRTPRHAMLTLANGWGWRLHPDLWVTCWRGAVMQALRKGRWLQTIAGRATSTAPSTAWAASSGGSPAMLPPCREHWRTGCRASIAMPIC